MPYKDPEKQKAYEKNRREAKNAYNKAYSIAHREEKLAYMKEYYQGHKEETLNRTKVWRDAHPDRVRATWNVWKAAHKEQITLRAPAYSKSYDERHPEQRKLRDHRHRTRKLAAFVENVDMAVLYERDKGQCGICHRRVSLKESSLDHILPLAVGGEHSFRNTQVAHRNCNSRKRDRAIIPQQLRIL